MTASLVGCSFSTIDDEDMTGWNLKNFWEGFFFLGKISYSTYLFHLILIYIIGSIENINLITFFIIFTISQFSLSALLYYFFESPILNARPMYKYKQEL